METGKLLKCLMYNLQIKSTHKNMQRCHEAVNNIALSNMNKNINRHKFSWKLHDSCTTYFFLTRFRWWRWSSFLNLSCEIEPVTVCGRAYQISTILLVRMCCSRWVERQKCCVRVMAVWEERVCCDVVRPCWKAATGSMETRCNSQFHVTS